MVDPSTATRNPLLIPELFQCILDCFTTTEGTHLATSPRRTRHNDLQAARRALAALARTCRTLSEPSLDRLWRRLHSLEPLIRCFAPTVDEDRAKAVPCPAEWSIITRYSHRVWELELQSLVDDLFLASTSGHSRSPVLFPNLRALRWSVSSSRQDSDLGHAMHQLFSPNLVSLSVTLCRASRGIDSFLQHYGLFCPGLKSVKLDVYHSFALRGEVSTSEICKLSRAICAQQHLESLMLSVPINVIALRHVVLSPRLREASLVLCPKKSDLSKVSVTSTEIPFRNVEDLELLVWDLQFVLSLLRPCQAFRTLRLRLGGLHEASKILVFVTALASPARTDSLQLVHITSDTSYAFSHENIDISYDNATHCLPFNMLRPLMSFQHLRELVLLPFNQIFLNDEELVELARNWPMLEVLKLNSSHGSYATFVTLEGLLSLLQLCKRLRELRLSLDARVVPEQTNAAVCNTLLTSLRLPDSPILNARLVAGFFARHLPFVTYVDTHFLATPSLAYRASKEYGVVWAKVNEYLCVDG